MFGIETLDAESFKDEPYAIWPEHEHALVVFLACETQWRATSGGVLGLDYGVVLELMSLYDVPDKAATLGDIRVIEARAIELLNRRKS